MDDGGCPFGLACGRCLAMDSRELRTKSVTVAKPAQAGQGTAESLMENRRVLVITQICDAFQLEHRLHSLTDHTAWQALRPPVVARDPLILLIHQIL
jgi:hypothetical protein